jgi:hypothetical protein
MDLLELGSQLGGAAIVACAEDKIEKLFKRGSVTRSAAQDSFEKTDGFLSQAVAGEEVDVRQGLGDELLRLFVELRLGRRRNGGGFVTSGGRKNRIDVGTEFRRRGFRDRGL